MEAVSRTDIIASVIPQDGVGIEYGPLHRVVADKRKYNVSYVDYTDRETLVGKYANDPNVDTALIPEIDIVTGGSLITEFLPPESLDYIIASHVAEHVPDLIGWLEANLSLLKSGGVLSMAYPDKRYCFDIRRPPGAMPELLAAYIEKRTRPNVTQICNHFYNASRVNPAKAWAREVTGATAEYIHTRENIFQTLRSMAAKDTYVDVHCWVFDPESLLAVLREIKTVLGLPFDLLSFTNTRMNTSEFFLALRKT